MTTEVTKQLMCICLRNGVELWAEETVIDKLITQLNSSASHRFLNFNGEILNTADIVGVFKAKTMDELIRRKNGQWKCVHGNWHDRSEKCECPSKEYLELIRKREEAIKRCGKCQSGILFSRDDNAVRMCECVKPFTRKHTTTP